MQIRRGDIVSHSEAVAWGVGKVVEVTAARVSIEFNDGSIRKIACSHFARLLPADPASFIPVGAPAATATVKAPRQRKAAAAKKLPA